MRQASLCFSSPTPTGPGIPDKPGKVLLASRSIAPAALYPPTCAGPMDPSSPRFPGGDRIRGKRCRARGNPGGSMPKPRIHPVVWQPPKAPARALERSSATRFDLRLVELPGVGPEDVVVDADGSVITGISDGRILRVGLDGDVTEIADTHGHPLGIELADDGSLIVCDCQRGLLRVNPRTGATEVIVDRFEGARFRFCNNATVARDGSVYFTDSSTEFRQDHYTAELLAHSGTGRLFRWTPGDGIELILHGLDFANGVTLSPDGTFLVIAETGSYRLRRYWLDGSRAGQNEILVDNLPGFPDNLSTGDSGLIWVALPSCRNRILDALSPRPPLLRKVAWAIPRRLQPKETPTVWVQAYDADGMLVHDLQTTHSRFHMVTGMREFEGGLWLGSLKARAIGCVAL